DDDDTIRSLVDRSVSCCLDARRVVAVVAHLRDIRDLEQRSLSAYVPFDTDRFQARRRMRRGIARKLIACILVLVREHAVPAIDAEGNVDDERPAGHAAFPIADSHFSTCTQQVLGMMPS